MTELERVLSTIDAASTEAASAARAHHLNLTKPPGSLGVVEDIGAQLAAIAATAIPPRVEPAAIVVFAADHGVGAEGVSPWPQEVTAQMVMNFCAGGAAINVIADANGLDLLVVNAGVVADLPDHPLLRNAPVRRGTGNLRVEPAMTRTEAEAAVMLGVTIARELCSAGTRCLLTGDMGIGNTTPSTALIAALTGARPRDITGRGTGIDDATLALKIAVIEDALARLDDHRPVDPLGVLAAVGGLEIAAIVGLCLGAAEGHVPVIVDGLIALAGALVATTMQPRARDYMIAGHRSAEPASSTVIEHLGFRPLLELDLRLGEGSGAALAYPIVRAAARIMNEMATFDQAAIGSA